MANNVTGLKAAIKQAFVDNLDATTRTKLSNRFVLGYQQEWNAKVAGGTVDNATNRGDFAVDKVFDFIQSVYRSGSSQENVAALPEPETIT
jgi:hypothetical protein